MSLVVATRGLSSCGSWALEHWLNSCGTHTCLLHGMWDLPAPGFEPVSPALAGRFFTPGPSGKQASASPVLITVRPLTLGYNWAKSIQKTCLIVKHWLAQVIYWTLYQQQARMVVRVQNAVGLSVVYPNDHGTDGSSGSLPYIVRACGAACCQARKRSEFRLSCINITAEWVSNLHHHMVEKMWVRSL